MPESVKAPPHRGVSCDVEWDERTADITGGWLEPRVIRTDYLTPPRFVAADDVVPTDYEPGGWSRAYTGDTLWWPLGPAGMTLRRLYREHGERALCAPEHLGDVPWYLPEWWESWR